MVGTRSAFGRIGQILVVAAVLLTTVTAQAASAQLAPERVHAVRRRRVLPGEPGPRVRHP